GMVSIYHIYYKYIIRLKMSKKRVRRLLYSISFTLLTTCSTVKPYLSMTTPAGAEEPKCSTDKHSPYKPTYLCQPKLAPISIDKRLRIEDGKTLSRYSFVCASKRSKDGIETTRTSIPSFARASFASIARLTSDPAAKRMASR